MKYTRLIPNALAAAALAACGGSSGSNAPDGGGGAEPGPDARTFEPMGEHHTFVIDEVILPTGSGDTVGMDVDGAGGIDNALAEIVSTMNTVFDTDLQANLTSMVDDGTTIILADLQATSLDSAEEAGFWILRGSDPTPAPCDGEADTECRRHLDGSGQFSAATASAADSFIGGSIAGGEFTGRELGTFSLDVPLMPGADPITVQAIGARAVVEVDESGLMSGRLAGALTESEVSDNLLPQLRDLMSDVIAQDCTLANSGAPDDCCASKNDGYQMLNSFDADASCDVSLSELQQSSLIQGLLAPDVDLLDAEGFYRPNDDGVAESISLGVGFTAVAADFDPPASL